jgi:ADP-ribose pyrophosphatase YjhB (NUDIX family)
VEAKEAIIDAVRREVREEARLDVEVDHITGLYDEEDEDFLHLVFACHLTDSSAEPQADLAEVSECGYWAPDALPRPISGYTVRRIRDAIQTSKTALPIVIQERHWFE